jgi:hypothetical protein
MGKNDKKILMPRDYKRISNFLESKWAVIYHRFTINLKICIYEFYVPDWRADLDDI